MKEDRIDAALRMMEFDLELTPNKAWLIRKTSQAFLDSGRPREALTYAKRGLELKPDDERFRSIESEAEQAIASSKKELTERRNDQN